MKRRARELKGAVKEYRLRKQYPDFAHPEAGTRRKLCTATVADGFGEVRACRNWAREGELFCGRHSKESGFHTPRAHRKWAKD